MPDESQVGAASRCPRKVLCPCRSRSPSPALALPAVASAADSVYWSNGLGAKISHANLDGSGGGGDLGTPGVSPGDLPRGVAIDATTGRIYWADRGDNAIYYANLNGSGAGKLFTGGATVSDPFGVAIDPILRAPFTGPTPKRSPISDVDLDVTGGVDPHTTGGQP